MRVLVHMERPGATILCVAMGMVGSDDIAPNRALRQQSSVGTDLRRATVGGIDSRCLTRLGFLASGILGVDRRGKCICLSLRGSISYSRPSLRNGMITQATFDYPSA